MYLERRLQNDLAMREKYIDFMRKYESMGHMMIASGPPPPGAMVYYIPHHCVTRKFRVVFDASCRTDMGLSLNGIQLLGERLQRVLFEIIMRFRRHRIAFVADIKMMFRQIRLARQQWDLQRIFWRESPREPLKEYWLTVVTYGMTSSAHNAVRAVIQCARDASDKFPEATRVIENDMYMDDCASGGDSVDEVLQLARQVDQVLRTAGFELRKWKSNSGQVASELDADDEQTVIFDDKEQASVLGLQWLIGSDQFTFAVKVPEEESRATKRGILSCVAQLYDPNGYIAPVTIVGRILIQNIWRLSLAWDEEVPAEIAEKWTAFWTEIKHLEQFRIDRWLGTCREAKIQLHGFSDASAAAYGAVVYVRVEQANGQIKSALVASRTRVAPLKTVTIPRVELAAAELLGRLLVEIRTAMEWPQAASVLWTDSMVVLHWLHKLPCDMRTFVANRVSSIQTNTDVKCWRHVGTRDNPADLLSRGVPPSRLVDNRLWLHGPAWLAATESEWPANPIANQAPAAALNEMHACIAVQYEDGLGVWIKQWKRAVPILEYASKLERALGILAHVIRAVNKWKSRSNIQPPQRNSRRVRERKMELHMPVANERVSAMLYLLRRAQEGAYGKDIAALHSEGQLTEHSRLASLRPIFDNNGIMRVGGRIDRASGEYEMRHPAIIPHGSRLSWLVIDSTHRQTKHGAVQVMMQVIRQRFWIPKLRNELRSFVHKCVTCARYNYQLE